MKQELLRKCQRCFMFLLITIPFIIIFELLPLLLIENFVNIKLLHMRLWEIFYTTKKTKIMILDNLTIYLGALLIDLFYFSCKYMSWDNWWTLQFSFTTLRELQKRLNYLHFILVSLWRFRRLFFVYVGIFLEREKGEEEYTHFGYLNS